MKRNSFKFVLIVMIIMASTVMGTVSADTTIGISINGEVIKFDSKSGYPFADSNNRTLVPFRVTLETFGAEVSWNQETKTAIAEKDGIKVEIPLGAKYIVKNGQKIENDTEAVSKEGKTYLPIRKVMEAFGAVVGWNFKTNTVTITSAKKKEMKNPEIIIFNIPDALEETRLTKEEVDALVGQDPSVIQDKIDTVYDLLQYMKSAEYDDTSGDVKIVEGSRKWHFNRPAESTIRLNKGNCGATSNLVNYVLKGDYDEVGYIVFSADSRQGGHVFNYIKDDGKYYIIDFLQFVMKGYNKCNYRVREVDRLEDYPPYCISGYGSGGTTYQIKIIVSYTADYNLPIANKNRGSECVMRFLPKDNNIKVLYETLSEGKVVEFVDAPTSTPNW